MQRLHHVCKPTLRAGFANKSTMNIVNRNPISMLQITYLDAWRYLYQFDVDCNALSIGVPKEIVNTMTNLRGS